MPRGVLVLVFACLVAVAFAALATAQGSSSSSSNNNQNSCTTWGTCNGHAGQVLGTPPNCQCVCNIRFVGATCNQCAAGWQGYPTCLTQACTNGANCNGHAISVTGNPVWGGCACVCYTGFTGGLCQLCAPGYSGYPFCSSVATPKQEAPGSSSSSGDVATPKQESNPKSSDFWTAHLTVIIPLAVGLLIGVTAIWCVARMIIRNRRRRAMLSSSYMPMGGGGGVEIVQVREQCGMTAAMVETVWPNPQPPAGSSLYQEPVQSSSLYPQPAPQRSQYPKHVPYVVLTK